eukprot:scaffold674_cov371-Prasinococcus_capsulatus_cf.AAC.7
MTFRSADGAAADAEKGVAGGVEPTNLCHDHVGQLFWRVYLTGGSPVALAVWPRPPRQHPCGPGAPRVAPAGRTCPSPVRPPAPRKRPAAARRRRPRSPHAPWRRSARRRAPPDRRPCPPARRAPRRGGWPPAPPPPCGAAPPHRRTGRPAGHAGAWRRARRRPPAVGCPRRGRPWCWRASGRGPA